MAQKAANKTGFVIVVHAEGLDSAAHRTSIRLPLPKSFFCLLLHVEGVGAVKVGKVGRPSPACRVPLVRFVHPGCPRRPFCR